MPTEAEELQAKEFLKRAEVRTMKKDLSIIRESDALRERDKIAKIKTLDEQLEEFKKANEAAILAKQQEQAEKTQREEVLQQGQTEERLAATQLKDFATEEERQQIFLLESQRFDFEKQIDAIDKDKDPALKLEKNQLLLKQRDWQTKLNSILLDEKKLEDEEKAVTEKSQTTNIASQRKGLEERKWDLEKETQEIEKKRWAIEKEIEDIENKVTEINKSSDMLVTEKNGLRDKVLGVDKSLRDIYSVIIAREEAKRQGKAAEEVARKEELEKARAEERQKVQREQWSGISAKRQSPEDGYLSKAPEVVKKRILESAQGEEERRQQFLQDVESWSQDKRDEVSQTVSPVERASMNEAPVAPQKKIN